MTLSAARTAKLPLLIKTSWQSHELWLLPEAELCKCWVACRLVRAWKSAR